MILKREGESRQEVDLAGPGAAEVPLASMPGEPTTSEMPLPVCPDGSPRCNLPPEEEVPGASPLDAGLRRMDEALGGPPPQSQAEQGGTP
jgi:hypothetical protein